MLFNSCIPLFYILACIFPSSIFEEEWILSLDYDYVYPNFGGSWDFSSAKILEEQNMTDVFRGYNIWGHQNYLNDREKLEKFLQVQS